MHVFNGMKSHCTELNCNTPSPTFTFGKFNNYCKLFSINFLPRFSPLKRQTLWPMSHHPWELMTWFCIEWQSIHRTTCWWRKVSVTGIWFRQLSNKKKKPLKEFYKPKCCIVLPFYSFRCQNYSDFIVSTYQPKIC